VQNGDRTLQEILKVFGHFLVRMPITMSIYYSPAWHQVDKV